MITLFVLDSKTVKDVRELQMVLKEWRLDSQQQMKFNLAKFKVTCTGRTSLNLCSAMGPKLVGSSQLKLS